VSEEKPDISKVPPEKIARWKTSYANYQNSKSNSGIVRKVKSLSFDEYCAWVLQREINRRPVHRATLDKKKAIRDALPSRALKPIEDLEFNKTFALMATDEKYVPTSEQFYRFALLFQSAPIDKIRVDKFGDIPHEIWAKFLKFFYNFYHANPEQVAMDLRKIREISLESLTKQIETLTLLQKKTDKPGEKADYAKTIGVLTNQLSSISSQFARDLSQLGLVGSKVRGGINIQIINKIPRPTHSKSPTPILSVAPDMEDIIVE
jgi:hypothetical protein